MKGAYFMTVPQIERQSTIETILRGAASVYLSLYVLCIVALLVSLMVGTMAFCGPASARLIGSMT
jgi:hypothetical protein